MSSTTNTFVKSFTHLKDRPKADQALPLLQRIASLVKPIMRKHSWMLPVLSEFFPESPNLVGLNINAGQKIFLRLRPAHAPDTFYDEEDIVHTMLHELTHNVHGPHDEKFYKFLAGLEEEYYALKRSGYAGEGFFSKGQRLGTNVSHDLPPHLARQRALEAAEKRRQISAILGDGGRLGGVRGTTNKSPRQLAAEAAERRARDEKACASGAVAQKEVEKAAKESIEDRVIDLTASDSDPDSDVEIVDGPIAGPSKVVASTTKAANAARTPSGRTSTTTTKRSRPIVFTPSATPASGIAVDASSTKWSCTQCTLVNEAEASRCAVCDFARPRRPPSTSSTPSAPAATTTDEWACPRCTLMNDAERFRCATCDAPRLNVKREPGTDGWTCTVCGEGGTPNDFWSCGFCGSIKTQS
ncbi:WLM-domain-containing protein [Rhodofomes roseus]|uniref:WLM-domain-containing protein n=1 Tax=Rhodofomes roseus TaxID=34475 RepID=A0ABQ8KHP6_9APHY|nr:WLM-domain-containing protein [Rhodofomes roseus]KAH9837355.1 WLM-domain-containing protein [Rhodofomes roseus]